MIYGSDKDQINCNNVAFSKAKSYIMEFCPFLGQFC